MVKFWCILAVLGIPVVLILCKGFEAFTKGFGG